MPEQIQDKIISFEDFNEYNISFPVIINRWEVRKVHGFDKYYLQIYFQKICENIKAIKFQVKCYSTFEDLVDTIDYSIKEIDRKELIFSERILLKSEISKIKIILQKYLLLDDIVVEPKENQIITNSFESFNEADLTVGKRLLPKAKGFPIDNVSHWYCACGLLYSSTIQRCGNCNKSKDDIFALINPDKVNKEKVNEKDRQIESIKTKKKQLLRFASIASSCIAFILVLFLILWFTVIPTPTVKQNGLIYHTYYEGDYGEEVKYYNIASYEGDKKVLTLQPYLRSVPLVICDYVEGGECIETVILKKGFKDEKYLIRFIGDCEYGFKNLKQILVEDRWSAIDSDRMVINDVEVIFDYKG